MDIEAGPFGYSVGLFGRVSQKLTVLTSGVIALTEYLNDGVSRPENSARVSLFFRSFNYVS